MMRETDKVQALAAVLRETGATPRIAHERVARSTLYDLDYHVALIGCAFMINGDKRTDGTRSLVTHWLKLLQFIAVRPALLPDVQRWAKGRLHPDLDAWQAMPRGYLGDRTHDRTVELLIASGVLHRMPAELQGGQRFGMLERLYGETETRGLLQSERDVLRVMAQIPVNRTMLRGE